MAFIPGSSQLSAPFWQGLANGKLLTQRCDICGNKQSPPLPRCSQCHSASLAWVELSGRATLYAYTIAHYSAHPFLNSRVPYVVGLAETEEGVRIVTDVINCELKDVSVGMKLKLVTETLSDQVGLVHALPAPEQE